MKTQWYRTYQGFILDAVGKFIFMESLVLSTGQFLKHMRNFTDFIKWWIRYKYLMYSNSSNFFKLYSSNCVLNDKIYLKKRPEVVQSNSKFNTWIYWVLWKWKGRHYKGLEGLSAMLDFFFITISIHYLWLNCMNNVHCQSFMFISDLNILSAHILKQWEADV